MEPADHQTPHLREVGIWEVDWAKATERLWEAVAFCGRYGHQPVDHVRHWPRSDVIRLARHFEAFVRSENRKPKKK